MNPVVRSVSDEPISQTVVLAVGEARDVDPVELDECLYDVMDPDALDRLFSHGRGKVEFTFAGCQVLVHGGERVVVVPGASDSDAERVTAGAGEGTVDC